MNLRGIDLTFYLKSIGIACEEDISLKLHSRINKITSKRIKSLNKKIIISSTPTWPYDNRIKIWNESKNGKS